MRGPFRFKRLQDQLACGIMSAVVQHILGPALGFGAVAVCESASLVKLLELEIQSEINTVPQRAGHGKPFCTSQLGIY